MPSKNESMHENSYLTEEMGWWIGGGGGGGGGGGNLDHKEAEKKQCGEVVRDRYEAVHPQSSWVTSLGKLCKQNEGNLQRKRGRKKASYLLNYSLAPNKTFRFVLSMHKSIRKTLLHSQELWGCSVLSLHVLKLPLSS